jgi:hypothetical protein
LKNRPLWAALITSVVLLQIVSPALAKSANPQYPSNQPAIVKSNTIERWATTEGTAGLHSGVKNAIQLVGIEEFTAAVTTGEADRITGFYVPEIGGFYVIQEPAGSDGKVSPVDGVLTQFLRPASKGVIGLLAHNYASGVWFDRFKTGSLLYVVFGDGRKETYRLVEKEQYQAVNGNSPTSDFINLTTGETSTAEEVYQQMYAGKRHLTLQTCIEQGDNLNWGRLFLLAELVE